MGILFDLMKSNLSSDQLDLQKDQFLLNIEQKKAELGASLGVEDYQTKSLADLYKIKAQRIREEYEYQELMRDEQRRKLGELERGREFVSQSLEDKAFDVQEAQRAIQDPVLYEALPQPMKTALSGAISNASFRSKLNLFQTGDITTLREDQRTAAWREDLATAKAADAFAEWLYQNQDYQKIRESKGLLYGEDFRKLYKEFAQTDAGRAYGGISITNVAKKLPDIAGRQQDWYRYEVANKLDSAMQAIGAYQQENLISPSWGEVEGMLQKQGIELNPNEKEVLQKELKNRRLLRSTASQSELETYKAIKVGQAATQFDDDQREDMDAILVSVGLDKETVTQMKPNEYANYIENKLIPTLYNAKSESTINSDYEDALFDSGVEVEVESKVAKGKKETLDIRKVVGEIFSPKNKQKTQLAFKLYNEGIVDPDQIGNYIGDQRIADAVVGMIEGKDKSEAWEYDAMINNFLLWGNAYTGPKVLGTQKPKEPAEKESSVPPAKANPKKLNGFDLPPGIEPISAITTDYFKSEAVSAKPKVEANLLLKAFDKYLS